MDVRLALSRSSPHPLNPRPVRDATGCRRRGDLPGALRPMRTRLVRSRRDCTDAGLHVKKMEQNAQSGRLAVWRACRVLVAVARPVVRGFNRHKRWRSADADGSACETWSRPSWLFRSLRLRTRERDLSSMNGFSMAMPEHVWGRSTEVLDGRSIRTRHCIRGPVVGFGRISLPPT
jgi:hypothetical protein